MAKWRKTISEKLVKMGDSSNGQRFTFRETLMALSFVESDLLHSVWSLISSAVNRPMLLEETTKHNFVFFFEQTATTLVVVAKVSDFHCASQKLWQG